MYNKRQQMFKSNVKVNKSTAGETIESKMRRITQNKEPIKDGAELIYTERKAGVQAGYNIRTDRFEVAVEAMDMVTKSKLAKRENFVKGLEKANEEIKTADNDAAKGGIDTGTNS